jgi:hypothetical protein
MRADQTKRSANEKKLASITSFHAVIGKSKEEVNELTHSLSNNPTKLDLEQMSALIGYLQRLVYQEGKTTTVESNSSGYYANATLWDTVLGLLRSEVQGGLGSHRELLKPPQESTEE